MAQATEAPVYCPELETQVLANIMDYVPWPGFGPFESYEADQTVARRRDARAGRSDDRRDLHAGAQPRPRHLRRSPNEEALFSGDVLFQGSVGRVDLPGGDWPTLLASIDMLVEHVSGRDDRLPGPHGGHHARARARHQPVPARARGAVSSSVIQAPRGTFDVLPESAARRRCVEEQARADPRRRRLPADRDAHVRGHRSVRARGGGGDRHRPEGDVHVRRRRRAVADAPTGGDCTGVPRIRRARDAQARPAREAVVPARASTEPRRRSAGATASSGRSAPRRSVPPPPRPTPS